MAGVELIKPIKIKELKTLREITSIEANLFRATLLALKERVWGVVVLSMDKRFFETIKVQLENIRE